MKKLNISVILLQLLGMIFFIEGILQLRFYTVAEEIICAANHFQDKKSECWNRLFPTMESNFHFWPNIYIWIFIGLLVGISFVCFLNWRNKLSALNTILVSIIMYILLRLKFFRKGIAPQLFNSVRVLFSDDFKIQCLIGGIIFTIIGIIILWTSVNKKLFNFKALSHKLNH